jgi:hypothetical protein
MTQAGGVYRENPLERRSKESDDVARGWLIAEVLALAWRNPPVPLPLSAASLREIAPLLLGTGAGAVAWRRIKDASLRAAEVAEELHQAYRLHILQAAVKEVEIGQVFSFLRSRGLEPLLGKGWAIARHYPEPGLRPYGDIDLYVRPEQHGDFAAALKQPEAQGWNVDLHRGAAELDDRSLDDLYAHSQPVRLGQAEVRIFGPEDHLRLLCLHLLREGALRPLWLCDIGAAIESRPESFDWDYFLSGDERRTDWVMGVIGLAHHLFGARIDDLPVADRAGRLPGWLIPTVLQQWGAGRITHGRRVPMSAYLHHPAGVIQALRLRWPNPIEATVGLKGPFNDWPRLPFQLAEWVLRTAGFMRHIPSLLRASK